MWNRVVLWLLFFATFGCDEKNAGDLINEAGEFQSLDVVWKTAALLRPTRSYQLDKRGVLRPSVELPQGLVGEWLAVSHILPDGTALDALKTSEAIYFVPDDTLQAQTESWAPALLAPMDASHCPTFRLSGSRLQKTDEKTVRPLGTSGGYIIGVDPEGGFLALSDVCANTLRSTPSSQNGPYIYTGIRGETAIAKEFIIENGPQPITRSTQLDLTWPICLQRIYIFLQEHWLMYSQGGIVDDSGHVIRPSTLVCAEADDPRLFIVPDRIYPRHTTVYDPFDHHVIEPEALPNMWNQWEVLIETFTTWRNLGSYWVKIEGDRHPLLKQPPIVFGWNTPEFPTGITQDSNDHAWLHPAGYVMPGGSLTNGNGRLQFTFNTWTPPTVLHLTLTAAANVHPNTGESPAFPGYPAGLEQFVYSDYPLYVPSPQLHGGYVSVPLDMTVIEWPE